MSITSNLVRAAFRRGDEKRDAGLTTPEDIRRFDDIPYGPEAGWNLLDVYRPKDTEGKLPVIVSVHGGGWVYGDKERYQYYCMSLAQHGFAVVNFTYRLAPEFKFPAPLEDTAAVFRWIPENAEKYGLDPEHVYAVGDSAGAHLLSLYCCLCTSPGYALALALPERAMPAPEAVALNCGVYRTEKKALTGTLGALARDFLPGKGTEEELHRINVMEQVTGNFPPAFIMTAEGDFLAGQARPLAEKLQALGAYAEYHYYGDKDHVLGHVFHCNMRLEEAKKCNGDECAFFRWIYAEGRP